ncbi:MAG TPA: hypothetical protein VFV99_12395 [Kofleriaceae bacterium]|nr:hypothetical protein [Kofleriaceae bacterium]
MFDAPMVVFRSFAIGLLAACFALLVMRPEVHVTHVVPAQVATLALSQRQEPAPTIVDVAPGISAAQLALAIRLAPGEQITSIDDVAVSGNVGAGLVLASRSLRSGEYIDFSVAGPRGERRVLALLH